MDPYSGTWKPVISPFGRQEVGSNSVSEEYSRIHKIKPINGPSYSKNGSGGIKPYQYPSCAVGTSHLNFTLVIGTGFVGSCLKALLAPEGEGRIRVRIVLFLHSLTNVGMG